MAKLKDKVQNALDEARMMILGAHLLLGFQLRSFLEKGYETLPLSSRLLNLFALGMILLVVVLLIAPTAYHRIVERGEDTEEIHRYASRVMTFALLPFALALGLDFYVAASQIAGYTLGALAGFAALVVALFFWYGLEAVPRGGRGDSGREVAGLENKETKTEAQAESKVEGAMGGQGDEGGKQESGGGEGGGKEEGGTKLTDKIKHVLTETRTVLPGAQALLGFQLVSTLMESFEKLPDLSKYIHLAGMGLVGLSIVLLMTPAAYHRIVERGEETEHFHRFAGRMVIAAMAPLALGICCGVYVVVQKVLDSRLVAAVAAVIMLTIFYEFWFGLTFYRRIQRQHERPKKREQTLFGS